MLLPITNSNKILIIDDESFDAILKHHPIPRFYINDNNSVVYIQSLTWKVKASIGCILLNIKPGTNVVPDHINRNVLDCRRSNLRESTIRKNNLNRSNPKHSSRFRNVRWVEKYSNWRVTLKYKGHGISGGSFKDEIEAAIRADDLMLEFNGELGQLNFPLYGA